MRKNTSIETCSQTDSSDYTHGVVRGLLSCSKSCEVGSHPADPALIPELGFFGSMGH